MVYRDGLSYTHKPRRVDAVNSSHSTRGSVDAHGRRVRNVYIALIVALAAPVLVFTVQNFQTATLSLFLASVTLPMSLLVIAICVVGMLTDRLFLALLRSWVGGARRMR